jgi:hypothetical protein
MLCYCILVTISLKVLTIGQMTSTLDWRTINIPLFLHSWMENKMKCEWNILCIGVNDMRNATRERTWKGVSFVEAATHRKTNAYILL